MSSKPDPAAKPPRKGSVEGQTLPSRNNQPRPRLPHERDESRDSHPGTQDVRIEQAARDVAEGKQDTDRSPVLNELARREFPPSETKQHDAEKKTKTNTNT